MVFIWRRWIDSANLEGLFGLSWSITVHRGWRLWCRPSSVSVSLRVHVSGDLLQSLDLDLFDLLWKMHVAQPRLLRRTWRVCLFNDLLSLKAAQSRRSDMFGGEKCFGGDIIYRWIDCGRRSAVYFYFSETVHVPCTANRQLSLGVQGKGLHQQTCG